MAVRAYWKGSLGCFCCHCEERLVRRSSTSEGGSDEAIHAFPIQFSIFKQRPSTRSVIAGLDPAIHLLRKMILRRLMDARVKPGHDECRHLEFQTRVSDLAAQCARGVDESSAPLEGVGNAGCPMHPRPRVHL